MLGEGPRLVEGGEQQRGTSSTKGFLTQLGEGPRLAEDGGQQCLAPRILFESAWGGASSCCARCAADGRVSYQGCFFNQLGGGLV